MKLCSIYLKKKLRHYFLIFLKSYLRRNIASATRRPALKADQGHHHWQESSGVSNQHISLDILLSGWNSLSEELLKSLFLINLSWSPASLSIRQEENILTWGINFQKYLENWNSESYLLTCLQSPKETKMNNLTSCFSLSENKPIFWAFKSSSQYEYTPYCPLTAFSHFLCLQKQKSLFKSMTKHWSS